MRLTLNSTQRHNKILGASCREWEGEIDSGIPVRAFIVQLELLDESRRKAYELAIRKMSDVTSNKPSN